MQMRGMFVNIKHRMDIHIRKNLYFLGAIIVAKFGYSLDCTNPNPFFGNILAVQGRGEHKLRHNIQ